MKISDDFENEVEENVNEDVDRLVEDDTTEAEEDHVSMVTEVDVTSPDPTERAEIVERRRKRPSSPAITSLVRQFESINEVRLLRFFLSLIFVPYILTFGVDENILILVFGLHVYKNSCTCIVKKFQID